MDFFFQRKTKKQKKNKKKEEIDSFLLHKNSFGNAPALKVALEAPALPRPRARPPRVPRDPTLVQKVVYGRVQRREVDARYVPESAEDFQGEREQKERRGEEGKAEKTRGREEKRRRDGGGVALGVKKEEEKKSFVALFPPVWRGLLRRAHRISSDE